MKNILVKVFVVLILVGCGNSETEKKISKKEIENKFYEDAEYELESGKEKIALLAIIKNIPSEKLYKILREYYAKTLNVDLDKITVLYSENLVNSISLKYDLPKEKIANLIFSFKYEMMTKKNITDEYEEQMEQEAYENQEN